ncbi:phage tail protein [Campylobacter coli]|nr:phage tail protein [Campylobacter coli]EKT3907880.1 phage tail protein [Campylobacter coli]ELF7189774.1 phage tail protein [Campylobacter coli]ELJ8897690.1 phage tail protein [Campylobacter coli]ELL3695911.1 phage tail protein [Campylobacter coli]
MSKSEYYTILTKIGIAKFIAARASGNGINLQSFKLSSKVILPSEEMQSLEEIVYEANINSKSIDENNPNYINLMCYVPSDIGGFEINAIGIYDEVGDLLAIGNLPRTYKPILKEGSAKELMIKIVMELSNAEEVILKLDPSVIMASRDYVDAIKIELKLEIETLMQQYNDAFKKVWDKLSKYLLESKFNTEIAKYVTLTTKQDINGIKNFTKLPTSNLQASKDEEFVNLGTLKKLISSLSNGLGVGQRYVDCIRTRSPNVTYTNTTGKPIMIIADSGVHKGKVNYYVDGNFLVSSEDAQEVTFIVPPNSTYRFSGPCYSFWELR